VLSFDGEQGAGRCVTAACAEIQTRRASCSPKIRAGSTNTGRGRLAADVDPHNSALDDQRLLRDVGGWDAAGVTE
jgi:hypothetical protein